jgi:formylglycine-generating enzyme required for sulfatase activity
VLIALALGLSGPAAVESAPHLVEIAKPFAGRYAVTFAQWDACYAEGACGHRRLGDLDFGRGKRPAIFVTWAEAQLDYRRAARPPPQRESASLFAAVTNKFGSITAAPSPISDR